MPDWECTTGTQLHTLSRTGNHIWPHLKVHYLGDGYICMVTRLTLVVGAHCRELKQAGQDVLQVGRSDTCPHRAWHVAAAAHGAVQR